MARDWNNEAATIAAIEARLAKVAPDNAADIPIAVAQERDENGDLIWTVDIHVRLRYRTEYEVTGVGRTFPAALRRAYLGLNNEANLRRLRDPSNDAFGVAV